MGAVLAVAIPVVLGGIASLISAFRSDPPQDNPTETAITEANRLLQEQEKRANDAEAARTEADRLANEAKIKAQTAELAQKEADAAKRAAQDEAEKVKKEAKEAQAETERQAAEDRAEAQKREEKLRQEALNQQKRADEDMRQAREAQQAAETAARKAAEETLRAREAAKVAERRLRDGIQPVVMPSDEELESMKRRYDYRPGMYHFAIAGIAGGGKSSLINAFRGLRNRDAGAAKTGITETTLKVARFPDADSANPFVWYDIPGAGTLQVRDWQYFNDQGLYIFDAIIVLVDNRFTATDVAILRNCRRFKIPSYIVRSKADGHIRNTMREAGYDSDDEDRDVSSRPRLEKEARDHLVSETRENIRNNLKAAELPDQYVYIVSNSTVLSVITGAVSKKVEKKIIDEYKLVEDFLREARQRRGGRSTGKLASTSSRVP